MSEEQAVVAVETETEIEMGDLENGLLLIGLQKYAELKRHYLTSITISKTVRKIQKMSEDLFKEYHDLLREFGTKNAKGGIGVNPAALTVEKAADWKTKIEKWRSTKIKLAIEGTVAGRIQINLPTAKLNEIEYAQMDSLISICDFTVNAAKEESENEKLKKENKDLKDRLEALE